MNEIEAIKAFINTVATSKKARRYLELVDSTKGRKRFLNELHHCFDDALREDLQLINDRSKCNKMPCYIYFYRMGFGTPAESFSQAYEELASDDSWVIVTQDGSYGVYRPEANWDGEILVRI